MLTPECCYKIFMPETRTEQHSAKEEFQVLSLLESPQGLTQILSDRRPSALLNWLPQWPSPAQQAEIKV